MDQHMENLLHLCRLCGQRYNRDDRVTHSVSDYVERLEASMMVNVRLDSEDIHPKKFCNVCYSIMTRHEEAKKAGKYRKVHTVAVAWTPHDANCQTCRLSSGQQRGGRPRKMTKGRGRPSIISQDSTAPKLINYISDLSSDIPSLKPHEMEYLDADAFLAPPSPISIDSMLCPVCLAVLDVPLSLKCAHVVCRECLIKAINYLPTHPSCPCCSTAIEGTADIMRPPDVLLQVIQSLRVKCNMPQCETIVTLGSLRQHHEVSHAPSAVSPPEPSRSPLPGHIVSHSPNTPSGVSLRQVLNAPVDKTPTNIEVRAATHLVKRMIHSSSECAHGSSLQLPTGGQPLCFRRNVQARVRSEEGSSRTVQERARFMCETRRTISGGSDHSSATQLAAELQYSSREQREMALKEAGILSSHSLSAEGSLAMKALLAVPWHKLRHIRRWLSQWRVKMASEKAMREVAGQWTTDDIEAEMMPFTFPVKDGEEIRSAPCLYIQNLKVSVISHLEELDRAKALTWHGGCIPEEEVWVKIGGDKGGDSFKMSYQIANTENPNSAKRTRVFCWYKAGDTRSNMQVALDQYKHQVKLLSTMTWHDKAIRVFVFGDYQFLCRLIGITGHTGRQCCLWCHITRQELVIPRDRRGLKPARTLATLHADLQRFETAERKDAKSYNNVIAPPLFEVPVDQIAIPALHISLGIFDRLYTLYEDACHGLDVKLAVTAVSAPVQAKDTYVRYAAQLQEMKELKQKQDEYLNEAKRYQEVAVELALFHDCEIDGTVNALQQEAKKRSEEAESLRKQILSLTPAHFAAKDGPFVQALEDSLHQCGVDRQAYHGGSFIGNHVHKCLQAENIERLAGAVLSMAQKQGVLQAEAQTVNEVFQKILTLFAKCHNTYSRSRPMSDADIAQFSTTVDEFLGFYRESFPDATITPKLHMLEDHVVPWMKKWHWALGLHGEQGAESIHNIFNTLERTYSAVRNPLARMKCIFKEHQLQTSAHTASLQPTVVKRKKDNSINEA